MTVFDLIATLSQYPQVSGVEGEFPQVLAGLQKDSLGNVYLTKKGSSSCAKTILFEAHRDEVGLCVSEILDGGFVKAVPCGGLDAKMLPGCRFEIIGKERVHAIAASVPPHLAKVGQEKDDKNKKETVEDLYLDTGFASSDELKKRIRIGDPVVFSVQPAKMHGGKITGRSLDNKASVAALLLAAEKITAPKNNVIFLFSVGEETSSRGVRRICRKFSPDAAVVVDAGFAFAEGMDETKCIQMGKGPSISFTDTLSYPMSQHLLRIGADNGIPLQRIAEPGGTGTSATAVQVEAGGIPSGVVSIPVSNMHTPGEIVCESDVEATADLLCAVANDVGLPEKEVKLL